MKVKKGNKNQRVSKCICGQYPKVFNNKKSITLRCLLCETSASLITNKISEVAKFWNKKIKNLIEVEKTKPNSTGWRTMYEENMALIELKKKEAAMMKDIKNVKEKNVNE